MAITFEPKGFLKFCFQNLTEKRLLFNLVFLITKCSFSDIASQKVMNKNVIGGDPIMPLS